MDHVLASTRASKLFSVVDSCVMREVVGTGWKLGSLKMARHQGREKSEAFSLDIVGGGEEDYFGYMRLSFEVDKVMLRIRLVVDNVFIVTVGGGFVVSAEQTTF